MVTPFCTVQVVQEGAGDGLIVDAVGDGVIVELRFGAAVGVGPGGKHVVIAHGGADVLILLPCMSAGAIGDAMGGLFDEVGVHDGRCPEEEDEKVVKFLSASVSAS